MGMTPMPHTYMTPANLSAICVAKNHMMKAKAILTKAGLAFTVTWEPIVDPIMQAIDVAAISGMEACAEE